MKRFIAGMMALVMLLGFAFAHSAFAEEKKLSVVTTIFPVYDWVREVVGENENVDITLLLNSGVDLHSYQPTAEDIMKIATCDVFVYVGGESDEWVEDALKEAGNPDMKVINLVEAMGDGVKLEEIVEGMEHDHDHEHSEAHAKEVSTFEDHEVQDRALSDWAGEWQSGYPYVLDGTLDEGFRHKAESGSMTAEEYKAYYATGYETDIQRITIDGDANTIEYAYKDGKVLKSEYKYLGYYIQNWSSGTRAAMYRFEALDRESGAPVYIEFNDHIIEPCRAEHFHFRCSDTSFDDIEDPESRWPTFWPAEMTGEDILAAFIGHDHGDDDDHEHEHDEPDEHVWLSLRNAQVLCQAIADVLGEADPANAGRYQANAQEYEARLAALDIEFVKAVKEANVRTVLFGDRFPFRYLVDDYGLSYYAAFSGCSAESEASFETIVFLSGKVDELDLPAVLTIEGDNHRIAETVVQNTRAKSAKILTVDSMQSTTSADVKNGVTYLGVMTDNLEILKQALTK